MKTLRALIFILILSPLFVVPARMSGQAPDTKEEEMQRLQQQVDALQSQVSALQGQIRKLSADNPPESSAQQPKPAEDQQQSKSSDAVQGLKTGPAVNQATAQYQTESQDQLAAPRVDNSPLDPRFPNYFRLPGTKTFMRIGGYAKSDLTFDPSPAGDQERFIPATIPIPEPAAHPSTSTISVRPSRVNVDFLVPTEKRTLRFFVEVDFFGSNATTPRLRHAYAQGRNILVGQTFSNFMDPDAGPDTLDFQGPNSQISIRNPQVRYTWKIEKSNSFSISVEKPTSDVAFSTPEFAAQTNSPSPDGTVQFRHEMTSGHVQLSALMRNISAFLPDGRSDSVFGWGFNLAGLQKIFGKDALVYQGAYGNGIQRYMNDTSGLGIDAQVISAQEPRLEAVPLIGTYGGYQHYWFSKLRSSVVYGFAQAQTTPAEKASAYHRSEYGAANLIWSPISSLNFGAEFLYGNRVNKDNSTGNARRIQLSAKYNFMEMMSSKK